MIGEEIQTGVWRQKVREGWLLIIRKKDRLKGVSVLDPSFDLADIEKFKTDVRVRRFINEAIPSQTKALHNALH